METEKEMKKKCEKRIVSPLCCALIIMTRDSSGLAIQSEEEFYIYNKKKIARLKIKNLRFYKKYQNTNFHEKSKVK